MHKALEQADREIQSLKDTLTRTERELTRTRLRSDEWLAIANELQVQLEVIVNTSSQACDMAASAADHVKAKAREALAAAKDRAAKSGMALQSSTIHPVMSDEETKQWEQRLAPRKPDEPVQP
jgi:hypothetical protein